MPASSTSTVSILLTARDDTAAAFESLKGRLEGLRSKFEGVGSLVLGGLGFEAVNAAIGGIGDLATGLISANMAAQNLHQTLISVYGSATEADQAFAWIRNNEQKVPFDLSSIQQASVLVATYGGDITKVMPMLETLAAVHKQTLQTAAVAWQDLTTANLPRMMMRDFGITKEMLIQTGQVALDTKGKLTGNIEGALEELVSKRYPNAMAQQMGTLSGALSSLETQFTLFEQTAGGQVFATLQKNIVAFVTYLQGHQGQVQAFATSVGAALGSLSGEVFTGIRWLIANLPTAINVIGNVFKVLSTVVSATFGAISATIQSFGNWFQSNVAPLVYEVIGEMSIWWQEHGTQVQTAVSYITTTVQAFASTMVSGLRATWGIIAADAQVLWDELSMIWTLGSDAISGNWSQFGTDLLSGMKTLGTDLIKAAGATITGVVTIFGNITDLVIRSMGAVNAALLVPFDAVAHSVAGLYDKLKTPISAIAAMLAVAFTPFLDGAKLAINGVMLLLQGVFKAIPSNFLASIGVPGGGKLQDLDKTISSYKMQPLTTPGQAYSDTFAAMQKLQKPLDLKNLDLAGMTKGGFDKAAAAVKASIDPINKAVTDATTLLANLLDPNHPTNKKGADNALKLGQSIVSNLFNGLGALASGLTGGNNNLGANIKSSLPDLTGLSLPVNQPFNGGPEAATAAAGSAASARLPTGRVPLGNLGATFMSTMATMSQLHQGTDPATRAAQQTAEGQQKQISQADTQTKLMQDGNALMKDAANALHDVRGFLAHLTGPQASRGNGLQSRGVARPAL